MRKGRSRLPARSALLPAAEVSTGHPRPLYPSKKRGDLKMRERTKQINFRVYPTEAEVIKRKARRCGAFRTICETVP